MTKKKKPRKAYDDDEEIVSDGDRYVCMCPCQKNIEARLGCFFDCHLLGWQFRFEKPSRKVIFYI